MRHLACSVRYSVVPINSSLLIVTLYYSFITTQNIQSLSWRYNRVRLFISYFKKRRVSVLGLDYIPQIQYQEIHVVKKSAINRTRSEKGPKIYISTVPYLCKRDVTLWVCCPTAPLPPTNKCQVWHSLNMHAIILISATKFKIYT
jgi:hypothetical protein